MQKKVLIVLIMAAVFVAVVGFEVLLPKTVGSAQEVRVTIVKGSGSSVIAQELVQQGIIKSAMWFRAYAVVSGNRGRLQAGDYLLSPGQSIAQIVGKMAAGDTIKEKITILEGWTIQDIANAAQSKDLFTKQAVLQAALQNYNQQFSFLKDKPANATLEGYFFPDSYELTSSQTANDLVVKALANFDRKLTSDLRAEITKQKKSIFQIVTMASMLEKEVQSLKDKKIVAGILWKRLAAGMPLQVDATIYYATHKTTLITTKDKAVRSPYNTYKYYGLPPGPISNPGLDSIMAAIYPQSSDYWYYLSADGTGKTIFSKTLDQHLVAIQTYLNH